MLPVSKINLETSAFKSLAAPIIQTHWRATLVLVKNIVGFGTVNNKKPTEMKSPYYLQKVQKISGKKVNIL